MIFSERMSRLRQYFDELRLTEMNNHLIIIITSLVFSWLVFMIYPAFGYFGWITPQMILQSHWTLLSIIGGSTLIFLSSSLIYQNSKPPPLLMFVLVLCFHTPISIFLLLGLPLFFSPDIALTIGAFTISVLLIMLGITALRDDDPIGVEIISGIFLFAINYPLFRFIPAHILLEAILPTAIVLVTLFTLYCEHCLRHLSDPEERKNVPLIVFSPTGMLINLLHRSQKMPSFASFLATIPCALVIIIMTPIRFLSKSIGHLFGRKTSGIDALNNNTGSNGARSSATDVPISSSSVQPQVNIGYNNSADPLRTSSNQDHIGDREFGNPD